MCVESQYLGRVLVLKRTMLAGVPCVLLPLISTKFPGLGGISSVPVRE